MADSHRGTFTTVIVLIMRKGGNFSGLKERLILTISSIDSVVENSICYLSAKRKVIKLYLYWSGDFMDTVVNPPGHSDISLYKWRVILVSTINTVAEFKEFEPRLKF